MTLLTFAVIDVEKGQDKGNDNHNSKIIVVPFDGAVFEGITAMTVGNCVLRPGQEYRFNGRQLSGNLIVR